MIKITFGKILIPSINLICSESLILRRRIFQLFPFRGALNILCFVEKSLTGLNNFLLSVLQSPRAKIWCNGSFIHKCRAIFTRILPMFKCPLQDTICYKYIMALAAVPSCRKCFFISDKDTAVKGNNMYMVFIV